MRLINHYSDGIIDALEKVAAGMTMEQAREYIKAKNAEAGQDALLTGIGGVGLGAAEGIADATPISGKMMVIPGAAAGFASSKLKSVLDSPKHMYIRDGELTGRSIGGLAGGGIGAGVGAGLGHLVDQSGWGLGLGGLIGGLMGQGAGQVAGDFATERNNADVIRKAEIEDSKNRKKTAKKAQI